MHEKEVSQYFDPPFAGIILIRYAGIFSAMRPFGGHAPRLFKIFDCKYRLLKVLKKFVTIFIHHRYTINQSFKRI